jgi:hypothetical protein
VGPVLISPAPRRSRGVFISYRRDDEPHLAGRIKDRIAQDFGPDAVFMDVDSIQPGVDFLAAIDDALRSCRVEIVLIGPKWLEARDPRGRRRMDDENDCVRHEVAAALARGITVIPLVAEGASMPRADELPHDLRELGRRNALPVSHQRFAEDCAQLARALRTVLGGAPLPG